jgi:hypothetical protein
MQNFRLKEFVEQNIQKFNPKDSLDLIKAEKLLKAESKLNQTFTINEIELFLDFIKNQTQNFDEILKLSVIKSIYNDIYPENISSKPDLRKISQDEIDDFKELFSPNLKVFISEALRKNHWQSLIYFQQYYAVFFSSESLDFYKNVLHERNELIIEGIIRNRDLVTFKENYPFATERKFYYLQSLIDDFEFDDDILSINNVVAEKQRTNIKNKVILGEILTAIYSFNSANEITKNVIRNNQKVAQDWQDEKSGFLNRIAYSIAGFFLKNQNPGLIIFLSAVIILSYLSSFIYVYSLGVKALMFYLLTNVVASYFAFRNFKYYFSQINFKDKVDSLGKISATILITMIISFPLMIVIGLGSLYIFDSFTNHKFPTQMILPVIIIGVKIFMYRNRK